MKRRAFLLRAVKTALGTIAAPVLLSSPTATSLPPQSVRNEGSGGSGPIPSPFGLPVESSRKAAAPVAASSSSLRSGDREWVETIYEFECDYKSQPVLCPLIFKSEACGYSGSAEGCNHTLGCCQALGNEQRFRGTIFALCEGPVGELSSCAHQLGASDLIRNNLDFLYGIKGIQS